MTLASNEGVEKMQIEKLMPELSDSDDDDVNNNMFIEENLDATLIEHQLTELPRCMQS